MELFNLPVNEKLHSQLTDLTNKNNATVNIHQEKILLKCQMQELKLKSQIITMFKHIYSSLPQRLLAAASKGYRVNVICEDSHSKHEPDPWISGPSKPTLCSDGQYRKGSNYLAFCLGIREPDFPPDHNLLVSILELKYPNIRFEVTRDGRNAIQASW